MITPMPYPDFTKSVHCLDNKTMRRVLGMLSRIIKGRHSNEDDSHIVRSMWHKKNNQLKQYYNAVLEEYLHRGFKGRFDFYKISKNVGMPYWVSSPLINLTHKIYLLRENYLHYSNFFMVKWEYEVPEGIYYPTACHSKAGESLKWAEYCYFNPGIFDSVVETF